MSDVPGSIQVELPEAAATAAVGVALGRLCAAGDVLALEGELGAGKTSLVRGLAVGLGLDACAVASPTFVRMVEHEPPAGSKGLWLVHLDAYRMAGPGELDELGWGPEMLRDAVVAVEWASRVERALPQERLQVALAHTPAGGRTLHLHGLGLWRGRLKAGERAIRTAAGEA